MTRSFSQHDEARSILLARSFFGQKWDLPWWACLSNHAHLLMKYNSRSQTSDWLEISFLHFSDSCINLRTYMEPKKIRNCPVWLGLLLGQSWASRGQENNFACQGQKLLRGWWFIVKLLSVGRGCKDTFTTIPRLMESILTRGRWPLFCSHSAEPPLLVDMPETSFLLSFPVSPAFHCILGCQNYTPILLGFNSLGQDHIAISFGHSISEELITPSSESWGICPGTLWEFIFC